MSDRSCRVRWLLYRVVKTTTVATLIVVDHVHSDSQRNMQRIRRYSNLNTLTAIGMAEILLNSRERF